MDKQEKAAKVAALLKQKYPTLKQPLNHSNAHELLFATILSAQCTDVRVNQITPTLFTRYPLISDYAQCELAELKQIIRPLGFFNNKAKNIQGAAQKIISEFNGQVPDNMPDLLKLPGVARKTASVVLWQWYGKNEGFTVDTHVLRLSKWFGFTEHTDPVKVEQDLMQLFPQADWGDMSLRIILLGRELLTARNPQYKGTEWEEFLQL
jgi:endonuclease-3